MPRGAKVTDIIAVIYNFAIELIFNHKKIVKMEQKQKDILLVRDEKTGEIGVVAGLKKDGAPNLEKTSNNKDFILFDRGGDLLDNFFKNFMSQCKEPSRFGFYRIAADGAEQVIEALKELLKDPEANKDILASHKVDTSEYENQIKNDVQETTTSTQSEQKEQTQEETAAQSTKKGYEPIDAEHIDWDALEKNWGIKRDTLEQSGNLEKMLHYGKSDLINVSPKFGEEQYNLDARLAFKKMDDGNIRVIPHFVRSEPNLKQEFFGHTFTAEDKKNLLETGNMGRAVELVNKNTGELRNSFISIDRKTNEVIAMPVDKVRIPTKIGNTEIPDAERAILKEGKPIHNKEITFASGKKFTTTLQVNADKRSVEFVPKNGQEVSRQQKADTNQQEQKDNKRQHYKWTDENGSIRAPKTLGGVQLTPDQQNDFTSGKAILVQDMQIDKAGKSFTAYVRYSQEEGKPKYFRNNPDQAQSVTPANESKTQVAVNNDGKTNEATKHQQKPLDREQIAPQNNQQQEQQKRKGIKM